MIPRLTVNRHYSLSLRWILSQNNLKFTKGLTQTIGNYCCEIIHNLVIASHTYINLLLIVKYSNVAE